MKKSTLLKKAMKYLWDGKNKNIYGVKEIYICHCLSKANRDNWDDSGSYWDIKSRIDVFLGEGCYTYESWLERNHQLIHRNMSIKDIQEGRRLWMLDMIKHFESIGD